MIKKHGAAFEGGKIYITRGANELDHIEIARALGRHLSGDWGEVPPEDRKENELALEMGYRLVSSYTVEGTKIWIITEADRTITTVLLPEEY